MFLYTILKTKNVQGGADIFYIKLYLNIFGGDTIFCIENSKYIYLFTGVVNIFYKKLYFFFRG